MEKEPSHFLQSARGKLSASGRQKCRGRVFVIELAYGKRTVMANLRQNKGGVKSGSNSIIIGAKWMNLSPKFRIVVITVVILGSFFRLSQQAA